MEKKTKNFVILTIVIIASFLFGSMATAVPGGDDNLLQEIWDYLFGIEEEIDELSTDVAELQVQVDLMAQIEALDERIDELESAGGGGGGGGDADTLGGHPPEDFALADHTHSEYAPIDHTHDTLTQTVMVTDVNSYTVTTDDTTIIVRPQTVEYTQIFIPAEVSDIVGKIIIVKYAREFTNVAYVTVESLGTWMDGSNTQELEKGECLILQSDGDELHILSYYDIDWV